VKTKVLLQHKTQVSHISFLVMLSYIQTRTYDVLAKPKSDLNVTWPGNMFKCRHHILQNQLRISREDVASHVNCHHSCRVQCHITYLTKFRLVILSYIQIRTYVVLAKPNSNYDVTWPGNMFKCLHHILQNQLRNSREDVASKCQLPSLVSWAT
jgi:hypothetical protein